MNTRYRVVASSTADVTAATVLSRMLAGIGFRFYWATEGLSEHVYAFRPCEGARSIADTIEHVWDLLNWTYGATGQAGQAKPGGVALQREGALDLIGRLPHIGQIATLIRLAGSPAPESNPFEGTPPRGWPS